jgi:hypothetical protein
MINILVKFPDRQAAIDFGVTWGVTNPDTEKTSVFRPPGINIAVLGTHSYNAGTEEEPDLVTADGWFVRISAPDGTEIPEEIEPLIVDDTWIEDGQGGHIPNPHLPSANWAGILPKLP